MNKLPPAHLTTIVRISLEGGVAFLPGLSRARPIDLADFPESERLEILHVLEASVHRASDECGRGDQRYFRIELLYQNGETEDSMVFQVPENDAPAPLKGLWEKGVRHRRGAERSEED